MTAPIMPAQTVLILHAGRTLVDEPRSSCASPRNQRPGSRRSGSRRDGLPCLLLWLSRTISSVSPVAVASNNKAFLSSDSGASALDARTNPMSVGPQLATAGFAEPSCILLAQASRVHLLAGSGAKVGCCLSEYGATSVASGLSGGG